MKRITLLTITILLCQGAFGADEIATIRAYVDTNLCARLMPGPITPSHIECSQRSGKEKVQPVLVRLSNNMIFSVNKEKMLQPLVSQLAEASGQLKVKNGSMKLQDVKAIEASSIPAGDPDQALLSPGSKEANPETWEKIRHELAMMTYITEFDFISFTLSGVDVILTGWTVRPTNRDTAYNLVKNIPGVETVTNNIEVLPTSNFDMQIRAGVRAALQQNLSRYFWRTGSDIKIIVKNGQVVLLGKVASKGDSDIAYMRANSVRGAFRVVNLLRVESSTNK
jgi:hyperosmotically inducible periplasmic protein